MNITVFLGPSLPRAEARDILDARYVAPAANGDVYCAAAEKPDVIALIDGVFEQVPAVWHKEILYALSCGIHVYGASSMGALRAAELHPFGMKGIGRIFEGFKSGEYEDDDEVAISHASESEGFRPLSEALVNIREGLCRAEAAGLISKATHLSLLNISKAQFYPERSWASLPTLGGQVGVSDEELRRLLQFVRGDEASNVKKRDAILLLRQIKEDWANGLVPHVPNFQFERSIFWERLTESLSEGDVPRVKTANGTDAAHTELGAQARQEILRGALLLFFVSAEAERIGLEVAPEAVAAAAARVRRERGILTAEATRQWLKRNHMTLEEFSAWMELEALVDSLLAQHGSTLDEFVAAEVRRRRRDEMVPASPNGTSAGP